MVTSPPAPCALLSSPPTSPPAGQHDRRQWFSHASGRARYDGFPPCTLPLWRTGARGTAATLVVRGGPVVVPRLPRSPAVDHAARSRACGPPPCLRNLFNPPPCLGQGAALVSTALARALPTGGESLPCTTAPHCLAAWPGGSIRDNAAPCCVVTPPLAYPGPPSLRLTARASCCLPACALCAPHSAAAAGGSRLRGLITYAACRRFCSPGLSRPGPPLSRSAVDRLNKSWAAAPGRESLERVVDRLNKSRLLPPRAAPRSRGWIGLSPGSCHPRPQSVWQVVDGSWACCPPLGERSLPSLGGAFGSPVPPRPGPWAPAAAFLAHLPCPLLRGVRAFRFSSPARLRPPGRCASAPSAGPSLALPLLWLPLRRLGDAWAAVLARLRAGVGRGQSLVAPTRCGPPDGVARPRGLEKARRRLGADGLD